METILFYYCIRNDMEHARLNTLNISWPTCLAIRGNLLPSKIPHIPILVEKISRYVSLPGYEENRVKTVQTIGEIIPGSARICELRSVSPDCEATVTLSLERLPVNVVYLTDQQGRRLPIWEKSRVFKVYGTLERKDNKVILIADRLLKVQDLYGSLNTLTLLSRVAHPMYYQRNCVPLIKHLTHNRSMNVFTQCLNPLTGVDTWQEQDEHYDYHQEVARSSFADMLHDKERNEKYYIALKNAIEKIHRTGKEANVLDIGTGTGLLAMMAAKCGADTITACEAFTPMANCAAQIIEENGFADKIKLIRKRSTKMTVGKDSDMPKRANILVTEVFDTELIGEGALLTFRHAHEALLEKDCIVIPHSGTVWVQVVESSKVNAWNRVKPIKIEEDLTLDPPSAVQACSGAAAVHDMQLSRLPRDCFVALLPPQPIFRFDWSNEESLQYKDQVVLQVQSIACGTAHAIFMWWDLNMDTENRIVLNCAPVWEHPDVPDIVKSQKNTSRLLKMADSIPWRDHWMQAVYYLPKEVLIKPNEDISLIGYHDEYSFWFKLLNKSIKDVPDCPRPICSCDMHIAYSRTRIGQLNDKVRDDKYIKALRNVKKDVCLCFSDGCLLALALAKSGSKVFLLEQNFLSRKTMKKFVEANELSKRVTFIDSIDDLPKGICNDLDLIFGEPYFLSSILPWENLRFWYLAYKFPEHIRRMPYAATIRGLFVEFKDLHKIRAPLGVCEGFDLSSFDELVQSSSEKSDSPIEAQPLWEYSCKALSKPFDIARFDLSRIINLDEHMRLDGAVPIEQDGLCNGVALWVDWNLHLNCKPVSCGPIDEVIPGEHVSWDPYTRQGVHLFRNVSRVTRNSLFWWSFSFGIRHGEMKFDFSEVVKD